MKNQTKAIETVFELFNTIDEALEYIRVNKEKSDISKILLNDVMVAFTSIYKGVENIKEEFPFNEIDKYNEELMEVINKTLEQEEYSVDSIESIYLDFKQEIKRCLEPYILC